jgi:LysM repeat protein
MGTVRFQEGDTIMHKKLFALPLAAVMLVTILSACVLPASQAPKATPTSSTEIPFPLTTQPGAFSDILSGTQTAMAINGTPAVESSTSVPEIQTTSQAQAVKATAKPTKTAKPKVVVVIPTPERPATYALKPGEWPICIARRFNLNISDLFNENGLTMNSKPITGAVLRIPQNDSWNTAFGSRAWHAHTSQFTVQSGDTIYTIACYFGDVDPNGIIAANDLKSPYSLSPGQVIDIP